MPCAFGLRCSFLWYGFLVSLLSSKQLSLLGLLLRFMTLESDLLCWGPGVVSGRVFLQ